MRNFQFPINFQFSISNALSFLLKLFLFFLPWQTIWVYRWGVLNNVKWEYGTLGFYATEILLWIVIFLFMIWYWKRFRLQTSDFRLQFSKDRIFVLSCLFLISYLFISIAWSADESLALQQSLRVLEAFLLFFILFLGPLDLKGAIKWFVIGSIIPAILGIWQFLTQSTFAFKWLGIVSHPAWEAGTSVIQSDAIGRWLRAYSSFNHPNVFGGYLAISIIFSFCLLFFLKIENWKLKILSLMAYGLLLMALFVTFSRSALAVLIISLLIYWFIGLKRKYLSLISYLLFLFIILSVIFWPIVSTRVFPHSMNEIQSVEQRVSGYGEAWQIFNQHPWLGTGAGNYTAAAHELNPNRPGWEYQPVHNALALFVVEGGVIGLALMFFVIVSFTSLKLSALSYQPYGLWLMPWLFIMFSDHYLYSSYIGLIISAVFFAVFARINSHHLHS